MDFADLFQNPNNSEIVGFDNPADMVGEAVRRFAGQPFPGVMQMVKDALFDGSLNFEDDTGRVLISPQGELQIIPKNLNLNLSVNPSSKSVRVGYDSRQANPVQRQVEFMPVESVPASAGRKYADEANRMYQEENPDWYRY